VHGVHGIAARGVSLFLFALIATTGCDEREASPKSKSTSANSQADLGAVKISLVPRAGEPVDILIRWIPILETDEWVPGVATLINAALAECGTPPASLDVRVWVQGGAVRTPPATSKTETRELVCLHQYLRDKELSVANLEREHEVLIRIAPTSIKK
jgi:hypothetical protein